MNQVTNGDLKKRTKFAGIQNIVIKPDYYERQVAGKT